MTTSVPGRRILIVEDEPIVAINLHEQLEELGYQPVGPTASGEAAITLAGELRPDLVLMDIQLEGDLDGIAAAREIRKRFQIPSLFLSAFSENATLERAKLAEPLGYILKPIEGLELKANIEMALYKHRMEEDLREKEESYRTLANSGMALIWTSGTDKKCDYFNLPWLKFTGRTLEQELGDGWAEGVHPDDLARCLKIYTEAFDRRESFSMDYRLRRHDGQFRWIQDDGSLRHDSYGNFLGYIGHCLDITERKQAEESRAQLAQIVEHSEDAIIGKDLQGIITSWNGGAEKIFGYSAGEMVGTSIQRLIPEEQQPEEDGILAKIRRGESVEHFETVRLTRDGRLMEVSVTASPIKDAAGKVIGVSKMVRDITERKQLEAQNRALQKSESLGRMAGAIAHHFNNQLAAVIGNLDLLKNVPLGNAESAECLSGAMSSARKAAEMSGLMLTYLGQTHGLREPQNLSDLCRSHLPLLQASIPQTVSLHTTLPSPGPVVKANASQILQVLVNLLTNAWEACGKEPGKISLTVKTVKDIPATNRYPLDWKPKETAYGCLEVSDTGSGIAGGDLEKVFDPFFSTRFVGRGLGLAVVLGITREHRGCVTVESTTGRGSVFCVYLPVTEEAAPQKPAALAPAPKTSKGGTVLLVDEEPPVLNVVTKALQKFGYTVLTARDGAEAVEVFRQHQDEINFVLLDLILPGMDGWQVLTAMRKLVPGIPVILSSGYDEAYAMAGDHAELPQVFLGKPYELGLLLKAIQKAFP